MGTMPTAQELWELYRNDQLEELSDEIDVDDYMNLHDAVFQHPDGRLFRVIYEADGQGNYNTWRDETDSATVTEVEPYEVTVTRYRTKVSA